MTRLAILCGALVALGSSAHAAPRRVVHGDAGAATAAQKAMAAAFKRGRLLAHEDKPAESVAAFDAALRAAPDDARVLVELGWELRVAGDLPRAESVCRQALQASTEPVLRAPAAYNLGRVLEQRGDTAGAIAAYRESIALRENRYVRERLMSLDPAATSDVTRPAALDGPFASIAAFCATQPAGACQLGADAAVRATVAAAAGPWREAQLFTSQGDLSVDCILAVRTARGWFFGRPDYCAEGVFRHDVSAELSADDVLKAPGPELILEMKGTDGMKDFDEELGHSVCCLEAEFATITICGVGPSQTPSCTPAINLLPPLVANSKFSTEVGLSVAFGGDSLVLDRSDGKSLEDRRVRLDPSLREHAGRHRIAFP